MASEILRGHFYDYNPDIPPSAISSAPRMKVESSEAKNNTVFAISSARPNLPIGICYLIKIKTLQTLSKITKFVFQLER